MQYFAGLNNYFVNFLIYFSRLLTILARGIEMILIIVITLLYYMYDANINIAQLKKRWVKWNWIFLVWQGALFYNKADLPRSDKHLLCVHVTVNTSLQILKDFFIRDTWMKLFDKNHNNNMSLSAVLVNFFTIFKMWLTSVLRFYFFQFYFKYDKGRNLYTFRISWNVKYKIYP